MKFSFTKEVLEHLENCTEYEWLESNLKGAYSSSTIIGLNTRRQHGLLCLPYEDGAHRAVVLSKLEEAVFIDNQLYEISTNRFNNSIFPQGYRFIEKFELAPFPETNFRIQDRLLKKTIFLLDDENTLVVRYELKNQGKPVKLVIKPFLAIRDSEELTTETQGLNTDSYLGQNFVRWAPKPDMPFLSVHFNRGEFIPATLWYHNFKYSWDEQTSDYEDLLNPGFFQVELKPYQTLDLYFSSDENTDFSRDYERLYRQNREQWILPDSTNSNVAVVALLNHLAHKNDPIPNTYLKPDFSLRNYIISFPGLFTVINGTQRPLELLDTVLQGIDKGLLPSTFPFTQKQNNFNEADTPLWLFPAVMSLYKISRDRSVFTEQIQMKLKEIIAAYSKGTIANIYVAKNGLVFSGDRKTDTGWDILKSSANKLHRHGYLLEVNALWYNALKIMEDIFMILGKKRVAAKYKKMALKTQSSFLEKFVLPGADGFYDFISTDYVSEDFNIHQILPLSLTFSPCGPELGQSVLKHIEDTLLTPYGLKEQIYNHQAEQTGGSLSDEAPATTEEDEIAWLWSIRFYIEAVLKFKPESQNSKSDLLRYFQPVFDLLGKNILGSFPEAVLLSNPPRIYGAPDSLISLANITYASTVLLKI